MSRSKLIGIAALFALTALGAFTASSSAFTGFEAEGGKFTGTTKGNQSFTIEDAKKAQLKIVCEVANAEGYVAVGDGDGGKEVETAEAQKASAEAGGKGAGFIKGPNAVALVKYEKCTLAGAAAKVTMGECRYEFEADDATKGQIEASIKYVNGSTTKACAIVVEKQNEAKEAVCTVTVRPSEGLNSDLEGELSTVTNVNTEAKKLASTLEAKVEKVTAEVKGKAAKSCPIENGKYETTSYIGAESLTGGIIV